MPQPLKRDSINILVNSGEFCMNAGLARAGISLFSALPAILRN